MSIDMKKFEKDMAAFSFQQHQDFLAYLDLLKTMCWTQDWMVQNRDVMGYPEY